MTLLMRDQENLEKGIEQGVEREGARIAVRLYKNGFTAEQIADLTGGDVQKIKEIIEREA